MNRCSQVLSDKCTTTLAQFIKLSRPIKIDQLTFNASLKYSIINDPNISIEIIDKSTFEVFELSNGLIVANSPAISEARLSDFILGSNRVRKQHDSVLKLRDAGTSAAWLLVSTYYCAYFACIELCKIVNRISMSLDGDDLTALSAKATGPGYIQFFLGDNSNFVGTEYAGKLIFRSVGTKPHQAAWENAFHALQKILGTKGWQDANQHIQLLNNPDYSPSHIRNTWNYKRTDYFGNTGEQRAKEFRKLIGNPAGASAWLDRVGKNIPPLDPCIIAVLCETLASAISDSARRAGELIRQAAQP